MARTKRRLARDALEYIEPQWARFRNLDVKQTFRDDHDSSSPIRLAAQAATSLDPLADLERQLVDVGFGIEVATTTILELLLRPTVALAKSVVGGEELLQAVVISRDPQMTGSYLEDSDLRLWLRVRVVGKRPPEFEIIEFAYELFDAQEERGGSELVAQLSDWIAEFPAALPAGKPIGGQLVLLGNPTKANLSGTPSDWSAKLIRLASSFGMSFRGVISHGDASSFASDTLIASVDPAVERAAIRNGISDESVTRLTCMGKSFEDLLTEIANLLLTHRAEPDDEGTQTSRALAAGERVFHRKIGNSRKFDRFDEGSPKPCQHPVNQYFRVNGPKSTKGMARRYTNFEASMLFHCGKYPNCGVYAVFHHA